MDNLPVEIKERASAVFKLTVSYAIKMLKWSTSLSLPGELAHRGGPLNEASPRGAADNQMHYTSRCYSMTRRTPMSR